MTEIPHEQHIDNPPYAERPAESLVETSLQWCSPLSLEEIEANRIKKLQEKSLMGTSIIHIHTCGGSMGAAVTDVRIHEIEKARARNMFTDYLRLLRVEISGVTTFESRHEHSPFRRTPHTNVPSGNHDPNMLVPGDDRVVEFDEEESYER